MEAVTPAEKGRAYHHLLSRRWRPEDAQRVLGFESAEEARQARTTYFASHPVWTRDKVADAVLAFYEKHGRWPKKKDWLNTNGLPSDSWLRIVMDTQLNEPPRFRQWWMPKQPSSWGKSAWVALQEYIVARRKLSPEQIFALPNITVRRDAMNKYGIKRLMKAKSSTLIGKDEFGELWQFGPNPGHLMLYVKNSTPEPDGSYADYFLRVPMAMTCPQQAVAWTFGIIDGWESYVGGVET